MGIGEERSSANSTPSTLLLSRDGVFCLADPVSSLGYSVSGTLQGEGYLLGVPSLFVRLAGCNLRCRWCTPEGETVLCDTPVALSVEQGTRVSVERVAASIAENLGSLRHVVITGGEPLLQARAVTELMQRIKTLRPDGLHVTLETNGTLFDPVLADCVDLVSLSPKLQVYAAPEYSITRCDYLTSLQNWVNAKRGEQGALQFKFVVSALQDGERVMTDYLQHLHGVSRDSIFVMPACGTRAQLLANSSVAVEISLRRGWRYGHRLQLALWDAQTGV